MKTELLQVVQDVRSLKDNVHDWIEELKKYSLPVEEDWKMSEVMNESREAHEKITKRLQRIESRCEQMEHRYKKMESMYMEIESKFDEMDKSNRL